MRTITLRFTYEDHERRTSAERALSADAAFSVLYSIDQVLRGAIKYEQLSEETLAKLQFVRDQLRAECESENISHLLD